MQLRQMQYFVAIVEKNSFTEAAESCFISQSAISQQVQALEQELGVALLLREGRRFSLTEAGQYFYRQSVLLLDEAARVARETRRIGRSGQRPLRVGYLRSWGGAEIKRAAAAFGAEHPATELTLMNGTHEELYTALRRNDIDVAFNDHRRVFSEQYVNEVMASVYTYAELSAKSPLAMRHEVTVADLIDVPCILIAPKEQQAHEQDYYQTMLGFEGAFLFAEDLESARILVAANRGFLPIEGAEGLPEGGGTISRIPLMRDGSQIVRSYCLFWKKADAHPLCRPFADALKAAFLARA